MRATAPLERGLLGRVFGRKSTTPPGPSDEGAPRSTSFLYGESLPDDLRLPQPAAPIRRLIAGLIDVALAGVGGSATGGLVYATTGDVAISVSAAQGVTLTLWMLRDCLGDHGTRSMGKRVLSLEITNWDGTIASPTTCMVRNLYMGLVPVLTFHPLLSLTFEMLVFFDMASFAVTADARRVGDYMLGSRVVGERPGREERVRDLYDAQEVEAIKEEIEHLAPGLLAQLPEAQWYDEVQTGLRKAGKASTPPVAAAAAAVVPPTSSTRSSKAGSANSAASSRKAPPSSAPGPAASQAPTGSLGGFFAEVRGQEPASKGSQGAAKQHYLSTRPPKSSA